MVTAAASFQGILSNSLQRAEIIFSRFKDFSAKDNLTLSLAQSYVVQSSSR